MTKKNPTRSIFGIANTISQELSRAHPGCEFTFQCEPPIHLTVLITETVVPAVNPSYVLCVYSTTADGKRPHFLTPDAERMLDGVETVLRSFGGMTLSDITRTGREPGFWYSGPYFDNDLLLGETLVAAFGTRTPRDVVGRIWDGDYGTLDQKAKRHVSPYLFACGRRGRGEGW